MFTTGNLKKIENTFNLHCKLAHPFSKFVILGTFGLGLNIWFPGIPRHQLTRKITQKVPAGFSYVESQFSL